MSTRIARHIVVVVVVLVTLGGTGWLIWRAGPPPLDVQLPGVRTYDPAVRMPEFTLRDHQGRPFTRTHFTEKWTFLFFGYTHCPDVCPTTLASLGQMMKKLTPSALEQVQVVFISVDPERDNQTTVAEFVTHFNPRFIGITGHRDEQLKELTGPLNISYEYEQNIDENGEPRPGYQVHHMASVLLIDPSGYLVADAAPPHTADTLAALVTTARLTYGEAP